MLQILEGGATFIQGGTSTPKSRAQIRRQIYNMTNQFWAVGWAGLVKKKVWADYEQLLRPVFLSFHR
jgi:hypothetical protein